MKVKLKNNYQGKMAGQVVWYPEKEAKTLIDNGTAIKAPDPLKERTKIENKVVTK